MDKMDLGALDQPLEPVLVYRPLPWWGRLVPPRYRKSAWERRALTVRPMDAAAYGLYQESVEKPNDIELTRKLVRRIVPGIREREYACMTPAQVGVLLMHSMGALPTVLAHLGKAQAETTNPPSPSHATA